MKYKMTVTGGGGTETDGGDFTVVETPKTITFICEREPFFSNRMTEKKKLAEGVYQFKPIKINKYYPKKFPKKDGHYEAWRLTTGITGDCVSYMNNGHVARFWDDGSITVYPDQCGIPHYFEPIIDEKQ